MKIISGIIKALACMVYAVVILLLLIAAPALFGNQPVIILSGSMEPSYPVNGVTYYHRAVFDDISVGDVITFSIGDGSLATHRVIDIDKKAQTFTTKGDNNTTADSNPVHFNSVRGKTFDFAIPFAGFLVNYVRTWYSILAFSIIILLDIVFGKEKKKKLTIGEMVLSGLHNSDETVQFIQSESSIKEKEIKR